MSVEQKIADMQQASVEQTQSSLALANEVAGKMGVIDASLASNKAEFDKYLESQNPIFNNLKVKSRLAGLETTEKFDLAPGESKVLITNLSAYTAALGVLTLHLNHGDNGSLVKFLSFSGYGLKESDLGGTSSTYVNFSVVLSGQVGGESLSAGQCILKLQASNNNAMTVGVSLNFINMSAVGVSLESDFLM